MLTTQALNGTAKDSPASNKSAPALSVKNQTDPDDSGSVRLHITPFSPALLKSYLAPSILPLATNISYHTVETFPEKGFGYLELPVMEAQKLKKKLNGSILKGSKIRIEDAKPEKRKPNKEEDGDKAEGARPTKRAKKEKDKGGVMEGIQLSYDRKVKRGWTEAKGKGKSDKKGKKEKKHTHPESKYSKEPEMLFKTKLTPTAASALEATYESKEKKKDKKRSKSRQEVTVHEFEKNTKHPSFLKTSQIPKEKKPAVEYVDGQGWVDEAGHVVEAETGKARNRRALELVDSESSGNSAKRDATAKQDSPSQQIESTVKKSKLKSKVKGNGALKSTQLTPPPPRSDDSDLEESSADDSSSVVSSDTESSSSEAESQVSSSSVSSAVPSQPLQSITLTLPSPNEKNEVHPLEALFKRPKAPAPGSAANTSTPLRLAPIDTSFSFFGSDAAGGSEDGTNPVTPFTRQDMEWRGLRSAAPTPDTAAIGRRFSFPWGNDSRSDEEDDQENEEAGTQLDQNTKANAALPAVNEEDEDAEDHTANHVDANSMPLGVHSISKGSAPEGEAEESEFAKWFWENRGDNNRAWKKRRREALKDKRQRENRKMPGRRVG